MKSLGELEQKIVRAGFIPERLSQLEESEVKPCYDLLPALKCRVSRAVT